MQNWKNWCRLCAAREDAVHIDLFIKDNTNSSFADDLKRICNLKLENSFDLPSKICNICFNSIKNLKEFLARAIETQQMYAELQYSQENECNSLIDYETQSNFSDHITDNNSQSLAVVCKKDTENNEACDVDNENSDITIKTESLKSEELSEKVVENSHTEYNQNFKGSDEVFNPNIDEKYEEITEGKYSNKDISHRKRRKKGSNSSNKMIKYECKVCSQAFTNQRGYTIHMKVKHLIKKDPFTCKFCGKNYERKSRLEYHENAHLPTEQRKRLSCPHCDKKFNSESGRWSHIHTVHDNVKAVICEECGKEFSTKHHLAKHKISHTTEKTMQCPQCPAKFKGKRGLMAHIEIHGESYPCSLCGVVLNTKLLLKKHMVVHSDEKNYKCNFCNKDFKRSKELNYHLILHIGIKPFECKICNQRFVHDMTYRRHLKAMHPEELAQMIAKGERISSRNFPPPEQLKAMNEAAKLANEYELNLNHSKDTVLKSEKTVDLSNLN